MADMPTFSLEREITMTTDLATVAAWSAGIAPAKEETISARRKTAALEAAKRRKDASKRGSSKGSAFFSGLRSNNKTSKRSSSVKQVEYEDRRTGAMNDMPTLGLEHEMALKTDLATVAEWKAGIALSQQEVIRARIKTAERQAAKRRKDPETDDFAEMSPFDTLGEMKNSPMSRQHSTAESFASVSTEHSLNTFDMLDGTTMGPMSRQHSPADSFGTFDTLEEMTIGPMSRQHSPAESLNTFDTLGEATISPMSRQHSPAESLPSVSTADSLNKSRRENLLCVDLQRYFGPQSMRGGSDQEALTAEHAWWESSPHVHACFKKFMNHEEEFCGEWAVFYHGYSDAALLYEVQAALACVLFDYPSTLAPLPRIRQYQFNGVDASSCKLRFESEATVDREYRELLIAAMSSLECTSPGASTPGWFVEGHGGHQVGVSLPDVSHSEILETLLSSVVGLESVSKGFWAKKHDSCKEEVTNIMKRILVLADKYHLGTEKYGGQAVAPPGHMLQIFIRRDQVDRFAYPSEPWGTLDNSREPFSSFLDSNAAMNWGQCRIVADPVTFMDGKKVRTFVASSDETYHKGRAAFQSELVGLLRGWLSQREGRLQAAAVAMRRGPSSKARQRTPSPTAAGGYKSINWHTIEGRYMLPVPQDSHV